MMGKCLFCGRTVSNQVRLRDGGRASFCDSCLGKLERRGLLKRHADGAVELRRSLMEVIASYR